MTVPLPWPPSVNGPVLAMGRPRRPNAEREAVCAAALTLTGSIRRRAILLAKNVLELALAEMDGDPGAGVAALLRAVPTPSIYKLATCPAIDTGAVIRRERAKRMEARGWRRLPEREWPAEDRAVLRAAARQLAARYQRHMREMCA